MYGAWHFTKALSPTLTSTQRLDFRGEKFARFYVYVLHGYITLGIYVRTQIVPFLHGSPHIRSQLSSNRSMHVLRPYDVARIVTNDRRSATILKDNSCFVFCYFNSSNFICTEFLSTHLTLYSSYFVWCDVWNSKV